MIDRPTLTPDQLQRLRELRPHFTMVEGVLKDLESIGVDASDLRAEFERAKQIHQGLQTRFAPGAQRRAQ